MDTDHTPCHEGVIKMLQKDITEKEFLEQYDITSFDRPSVASDIVLLALDRYNDPNNIKSLNIHGLQILLIKRANHPFKGKWALPGGFCRPTESVYETAKRELFEETNVSNAYLQLTSVHSEKDRDPRGWIISNAWLGLIDRYKCNLRADTDAWEAAWFTIKSFESTITNSNMNSTEYTHELILVNNDTNETLTLIATETIILNNNVRENIFNSIRNELGFDHNKIIIQTLVNFKESIKEDIRPIFNLLPDLFTLGEVQTAYELIINGPTQNFRRRISDYVIETNEYAETKGYRPAKLFKRNPEKFKY